MVEQGKITKPVSKPANCSTSASCSTSPNSGGLYSLIPLTQGKFAIVDDADYERLSKHKWCAVKNRNTYYAVRAASRKLGKQKTIRMHREILGASPGQEIDHQDRNGLDNRWCNIRFCTRSQNQHNQKLRYGGTSKYKGVRWSKQAKKWRARIQHNKRIHLGYFDNEIEAAKAYDRKAKELFGGFANYNFPSPISNQSGARPDKGSEVDKTRGKKIEAGASNSIPAMLL